MGDPADTLQKYAHGTRRGVFGTREKLRRLQRGAAQSGLRGGRNARAAEGERGHLSRGFHRGNHGGSCQEERISRLLCLNIITLEHVFFLVIKRVTIIKILYIFSY